MKHRPLGQIFCNYIFKTQKKKKKKSNEIVSIKYGPGINFFKNTVQKVQRFASKYLKKTF